MLCGLYAINFINFLHLLYSSLLHLVWFSCRLQQFVHRLSPTTVNIKKQYVVNRVSINMLPTFNKTKRQTYINSTLLTCTIIDRGRNDVPSTVRVGKKAAVDWTRSTKCQLHSTTVTAIIIICLTFTHLSCLSSHVYTSQHHQRQCIAASCGRQ